MTQQQPHRYGMGNHGQNVWLKIFSTIAFVALLAVTQNFSILALAVFVLVFRLVSARIPRAVKDFVTRWTVAIWKNGIHWGSIAIVILGTLYGIVIGMTGDRFVMAGPDAFILGLAVLYLLGYAFVPRNAPQPTAQPATPQTPAQPATANATPRDWWQIGLVLIYVVLGLFWGYILLWGIINQNFFVGILVVLLPLAMVWLWKK